MANKLFAEVVIAGSYKNLAKSTRGAKQELSGFEKATKKMANVAKAAFAGVAIGQLFDAIKDVTKAAAEDAKTTAVMNNALAKNWKLTDKVKASVNSYIDSMSAMSGIVDDKLKPAYATVARQTKSQDKANKMLALSMNIAADKNIEVSMAAKLVAKAMAGNSKAFDKLYPSAKKSGDAIAYVTAQTAGAAKAAGANSPFERITATFDVFKEKLGTAFLPVVQKFADWLASGESQKALDDIAGRVQKFGEWFSSPEGQDTFNSWMEDLKALLKLAGDFLGIVGQVAKLLGNGADKNLNAVLTSEHGRAAYDPTKGGYGYKTTGQAIAATGNMAAIGGTTNIVINGAVSGNDVVKALRQVAGRKGQTLAQLLK